MATKEHNHKLVIVCCPVFFLFFCGKRTAAFLCDILTSIEAKPILKRLLECGLSRGVKRDLHFPDDQVTFSEERTFVRSPFQFCGEGQRCYGKVARDVVTDFAFITA